MRTLFSVLPLFCVECFAQVTIVDHSAWLSDTNALNATPRVPALMVGTNAVDLSKDAIWIDGKSVKVFTAERNPRYVGAEVVEKDARLKHLKVEKATKAVKTQKAQSVYEWRRGIPYRVGTLMTFDLDQGPSEDAEIAVAFDGATDATNTPHVVSGKLVKSKCNPTTQAEPK